MAMAQHCQQVFQQRKVVCPRGRGLPWACAAGRISYGAAGSAARSSVHMAAATALASQLGLCRGRHQWALGSPRRPGTSAARRLQAPDLDPAAAACAGVCFRFLVDINFASSTRVDTNADDAKCRGSRCTFGIMNAC